jgi:hypothetical protein
VLTTLPQGPAFEYTVTVLDRCGSPPDRDTCVQDLQENPVDPNANIATFLGLDRGQPFLASAISLGPDPAAPN